MDFGVYVGGQQTNESSRCIKMREKKERLSRAWDYHTRIIIKITRCAFLLV